MFRHPHISSKPLAEFCRSMARMLSSGVAVSKSLKTAGAAVTDARLKECVRDAFYQVRKGNSLQDAFAQQLALPPLFVDLLSIGEQTGHVPEVFEELARYYESRHQRAREFRSEIFWPITQLIAAILIIGLVIFIIGWINSGRQSPDFDILGLGLTGTRGAVVWFTSSFGFLAALFVGWVVLNRSATTQQALHPFLLQVPGLGWCMKSFAIARFSWCFALTQQAGMSLKPSIESSFKATANGAFINATSFVWDDLKEGESLTNSLATTTLFPEDYLQIVATAEETGTVPEELARLSARFDEDAQRAMLWLTSLVAKIIWGLVALFIGFIVIRFVMTYVNILQGAVRDTF